MPARARPLALLARLAAALALVLGGAACGGEEAASPAAEPRRAALALDFLPNAAHAGIYTAVAEGLDRDAGVDLDVRTPSASADSLRLLATGRADVAVVDIHDLGLARERGGDVVGVGALVQRPLGSVLAQEEIERPRELEGRRVGVTGLPSDEAVLSAIVANDGGDPDRVRRITVGFSAVPSLLGGRVAAATAFWNVEGVALRARRPGARIFRVDEFGAPPYPELVLATTRERLTRDRDGIRRIVEAVRAGTRRALEDPALARRALLKAAPGEPELTSAQLEAVLPALEPAVTLDRSALEGWAEWASRFGILRERPEVGRAFDLELAAEG